MLVAKYLFHCFDQVWFYVSYAPWLVLFKITSFYPFKSVQRCWINLYSYFFQPLSSFYSHVESIRSSPGSLAVPTHQALDNKHKTSGFSLEWPRTPSHPILRQFSTLILSSLLSHHCLLPLWSQVPVNILLSHPLLQFCAFVFPLAFVSWHSFSSFNFAYSWPQKCSLLSALAPNSCVSKERKEKMFLSNSHCKSGS